MEYETANCKMRVSQCADMEILPIERPIKANKEIFDLDELVSELHKVFSSDHVEVEYVNQLMMNYKSNPKDWKTYAKFDRYKYTRNLVDSGNGAFNIMVLCWGPGHASAIHDHADSHCFMKMLSGNLEEVRYDWPEETKPKMLKPKVKAARKTKCCGKCKKDNLDFEKIRIDNHAEVIEHDNNVTEEVCQNDSCIHDNEHEEQEYEPKSMVELSRSRLETNDVCYINDSLGLHRVENPSHVDGAVSLHLYCPPFDSCRVFDARTGHATRAPVTFWSLYGKKRSKIIM